MNKTNRLFLVIFFGLLWPSVLVLSAEEPSTKAASEGEVSTPAPEEAGTGIDSAVQVAQEEVRDPFSYAPPAPVSSAPVVAAGPASPEIKVELQGLGFGSKDAYAVIGGEVFYKGDEKNGIKLLEVRRREVDVIVNGGMVTVPLFPTQDLQNAKARAQKRNTTKDTSAK